MSVREYIGARYVPLFSDPIQWDVTAEYEPLVVVMNEGTSYVSKQSVPAGVQITNETYWLKWADYNAQLAEYQRTVETFDGRIDTLEGKFPVDTADIKNSAVTHAKLASEAVETSDIKDSNVTTAKIADGNITTAKIADGNVTTAKIANGAITDAKLATKHLVAIGDSFTATGYGLTDSDMWWYKVARAYNCVPHSFGIAGTGFVEGLTSDQDFDAQLDNAIASSHFDNSDVAYVIVMGGINDTRADNVHVDGVNYQIRIRNLLNKAITNFPHAKVTLAMCNTFDSIPYVGTVGAAGTYNFSPFLLENYGKDAALTAHGVQFISLVSLFCGFTAAFGSAQQGHHPNTYGQDALACAILSGRAPLQSGTTLTCTAGTATATVVTTALGAQILINATATAEHNDAWRKLEFSDPYGVLAFTGHTIANNDLPYNVGIGYSHSNYTATILAQIMATSNPGERKLRVLIEGTSSVQEAMVNIPLMV